MCGSGMRKAHRKPFGFSSVLQLPVRAALYARFSTLPKMFIC